MALLTENKPLPFYLLLAEAPSLPALDFVQILSGAGIEELEARLDPILNRGRVNRLRELQGAGFPGEPLFPRGDDRSFLETLFLKLTLLSDLLQQCLGNGQPQAGMKCDRVWVRIPPASGLLPLCWNFQIELLADIAPLPAAPRLPAASADALASLGLVWFQLLIRNGRVGEGELLGAVNEYLAAPADAADAGGALGELAILDNLFWHPGSTPLRGEWLPLWERACAPGYQLLGAAKRHDASCDGIVRSVEALRADLKAAIFAVGPRLEQPVQAPPVQEPSCPDDRELHGVLSRLVARSRQGGQPVPAPAPPVIAPDEFDETMETVILSPGPAFALNAATAEPQLDETYILPRSAPAPVNAAAPVADPGADGLLETVLLNPGKPTRQFFPTPAPQPADQPPPAEAPGETDELAETIVVMPQGGRIRPRFPRN